MNKWSMKVADEGITQVNHNIRIDKTMNKTRVKITYDVKKMKKGDRCYIDYYLIMPARANTNGAGGVSAQPAAFAVVVRYSDGLITTLPLHALAADIVEPPTLTEDMPILRDKMAETQLAANENFESYCLMRDYIFNYYIVPSVERRQPEYDKMDVIFMADPPF